MAVLSEDSLQNSCVANWYLKTSNHSINKHSRSSDYETGCKLDIEDTEIKTTVTAIRESMTLLPFYCQGLWLLDNLPRVETSTEPQYGITPLGDQPATWWQVGYIGLLPTRKGLHLSIPE